MAANMDLVENQQIFNKMHIQLDAYYHECLVNQTLVDVGCGLYLELAPNESQLLRPLFNFKKSKLIKLKHKQQLLSNHLAEISSILKSII